MANEKPRLAPVRLLLDYWPAEDERAKAGEIIELPAAEARELIAKGIGERADPLPGEE